MRKVKASAKHLNVRKAKDLSHIIFFTKRKEDKPITCKYFSYEDRKQLEEQYNAGSALSKIADTLGVHLSTIYRELDRGYTGDLDTNGRIGYNADLAQKTVLESLKRRGRKQGRNKQNE